ncbi:hypothetical protein [Xenorhabdus bovienii]|uniref:hypothetical protein n=2 Tax=Xenorhabdus bovienii TaxID=40576 RepID=UPI0023B20844|nr:hypothetical protein [Xenorhabdus bovienii]
MRNKKGYSLAVSCYLNKILNFGNEITMNYENTLTHYAQQELNQLQNDIKALRDSGIPEEHCYQVLIAMELRQMKQVLLSLEYKANMANDPSAKKWSDLIYNMNMNIK